MIHHAATGITVYEESGCKGILRYTAHGNEYVQLLLEPGGLIPEHRLPLAVSFYVLAGRGVCTVSGLPCSVSAGDMLECPPGELRGWKNDSGRPLEVLVIKRAATPPPG